MSVGVALAQAREERGLSVEDVSTATRIRAGLIRSIEADEFAPCGGSVYARGHIRSIARFIGVDSEPLIADYDRAHGEEAPPVAMPGQATDPEIVARSERKGPNWTAAMAAVLVGICILAVIGIVRGNSHHPAQNSASDQPNASPTAAAPSRTPSSPPPTAVAAVPSNMAVALVRINRDRSWVSVETIGHRVLFQGLLSAGQSKAFRDAKGLRLVIGNAPVVQLVADGRDLGAPRSSGNVAHVTVLPGGDVQFA